MQQTNNSGTPCSKLAKSCLLLALLTLEVTLLHSLQLRRQKAVQNLLRVAAQINIPCIC